MRYTASPVTATPVFSTVTWSAVKESFWSEVGITATASAGHLKYEAP